ncbi:universal stress protein [Nocardiopsis aegyptia]|uniref:Nucleotide-binding universal stress UspA family protein n=1 Tax=Nocardiopsis aegyptia TaxID=220378 RepID=A0A7Z0EMB2_9ACTN|nr:universal stress protein [Nocardiopsis aegyptia]NYJ34509.1 nucleotide-binding universal stress UspA family protein [Nocardiopsis aegyptia]
MKSSILVGVDGSEAALKAVDWAAAEAVRRDGRLLLLTAFTMYTAEVAFTWREEDIKISLDQVLDEAQDRALAVAPKLEVERVTVLDPPTVALLHRAAEAAMVVVGLRGRGGFPGLKAGSVAYRVAAHAPVPVVVVGPETEARGDPVVVVGDDGSPHGQKALAAAFDAAAALSARVHVVRAWEPLIPPAQMMVSYDLGAIHAAEEDALRHDLEPWLTKYPDVPVRSETAESAPVPALARAAQGARLLVVGARGRHGPSVLALGSTAHGLLHRAPCPVMIVHAG